MPGSIATLRGQIHGDDSREKDFQSIIQYIVETILIIQEWNTSIDDYSKL